MQEKQVTDTEPIRVLRKVFSKQFCFIRCNTSGPLNRGGIADLSLLRTLLAERGVHTMLWLLKSPKTNTLADGLIKRTSTMLDVIASKTMYEDKEGD